MFESVFIDRLAWFDPICGKALKYPRGVNYPWLPNEGYRIRTAINKMGKKCVILMHGRDCSQQIIVPIEYIIPIHLSKENLAALLQYKQVCIWCGLTGHFQKTNENVIACFDNKHKYIETLDINQPNYQLTMTLEIITVAVIDFDFIKKQGVIIYSNSATNKIVDVLHLDTTLKSLSEMKVFY